MNPKYTIYIPSKGRYDTRLTSKALEEIGVPYKMVVEYQEYDHYAEHIDHDNLLVLPFSNQGVVAARNWIRQYSMDHNEKRHWQIDDNISAFMRLNRNRKIKEQKILQTDMKILLFLDSTMISSLKLGRKSHHFFLIGASTQ
jgi:hypothetical protein